MEDWEEEKRRRSSFAKASEDTVGRGEEERVKKHAFTRNTKLVILWKDDVKKNANSIE